MSVVAVLAFHQGFGWAGGGFLGVSAFFTLSGFLISAVMLTREPDARTGQRMRTFWRRRARRLLPASWVAVGFTLLLAANGAFESEDIGSDAVGALANVANWQLIIKGTSYADLFTAPGAFQQFWSLAIEEQFYLVIPLLLLVAARRLPIRRLLLLLGALTIASSAWMAYLGPGDRAYYGTDTRAAELLLGVIAAVVVFDRRFQLTPLLRRQLRRASVVGLVALAALWSTAEVNSSFLYRGGFALHALATLAVIGGAFVGGAADRLLSLDPLVRIGKVSFGLYLFHWPIFLWLNPTRTGLDEVPLFVLRLAVTTLVAVLSYRLVEMPVRRNRALVWPAPLPIGAAVLTVLLTVALIAPLDPGKSASADLDEAAARFDSAVNDITDSAPVDIPDAPPGVARPLRVGVFGDSTALTMAIGLIEYGEARPSEIAGVSGSAPFGCTLSRQGLRALQPPSYSPTPESCMNREKDWTNAIRTRPIDVAVILFGPYEVSDHRLSTNDIDRGPGDPYFDAYLAGEMRLASEFFATRGIPVIWLTSPHIEIGIDQTPPPNPAHPGSDDARMDRYNNLLKDHVVQMRSLGREVEMVDLGTYLDEDPDSLPGGRLRPDGVHLTIDSSAEVARQFLGANIVGTARTLLGMR